MSCLLEERFIELLDRGGLEATESGEQAHLQSCEACRETWASIAAAGEVLAESRPRTAGRAARWVPLVAAAAMLLTITAVIALRRTPSPVTKPLQDPVALFLDGSPEEMQSARAEILKLGRKAIPGLVAARPRLQGSARYKALQALIWDLKVAAIGQDPEKQAVIRKLETTKIDLDFETVLVEDIIGFIRSFTNLNLVLDPTLSPGIVEVLKVQNTSLRESLDILCAVKGLDFDVRYGAIFVGTPLRIWSTDPKIGLPAANAWRTQTPEGDLIAHKLGKIRTSIDMIRAPFSAYCEYLSEITGLKVRAEPGISQDLVSCKVGDLTLDHVLEISTLPMGYDVRIEGEEVLIFKRAK